MKKITLIFISLFILIIGIGCASAADLDSSAIADDDYCITDADIGSVDIDGNASIADADIGSGDITTPEIDISSENTTNYTISGEDSFINDEDVLSRINTSQRDSENPILYNFASLEVTGQPSQYLLELPVASADIDNHSSSEPKLFPNLDNSKPDKITISSFIFSCIFLLLL